MYCMCAQNFTNYDCRTTVSDSSFLSCSSEFVPSQPYLDQEPAVTLSLWDCKLRQPTNQRVSSSDLDCRLSQCYIKTEIKTQCFMVAEVLFYWPITVMVFFSTSQQKALLEMLGCDWFLMFLQPHLHRSTLKLGLILLTHFLSSSSHQSSFREGVLPGTLIEGIEEPFVCIGTWCCRITHDWKEHLSMIWSYEDICILC